MVTVMRLRTLLKRYVAAERGFTDKKNKIYKLNRD